MAALSDLFEHLFLAVVRAGGSYGGGGVGGGGYSGGTRSVGPQGAGGGGEGGVEKEGSGGCGGRTHEQEAGEPFQTAHCSSEQLSSHDTPLSPQVCMV